MYKDKITFSGIEDVKRFSSLANEYNGTISLISGSYKVDAKSIMSIFTLDLSKPVSVEVKGNCPDDLIEQIKQYKV